MVLYRKERERSMSKILSVYNNWAFFEMVLPTSSNSQCSFLLDADQFQLAQNELISLECIQGQWYFVQKDIQRTIELISGQSKQGELPVHGRYRLITASMEQLSILVEERDHPVQVYRKYCLQPGKMISVGLSADNDIQYRYPLETNTKSFVSHHHCRIVLDGNTAILEDLSSNGTYINHVRAKERTILHYGDHIRVFGLSMVYLGSVLAVNYAVGSNTDLTEISDERLYQLAQPGDKSGNSCKHLLHRAPRTIPQIITESVTIDPPPNPKDVPHVPLLMQIGPSLTMALPMMVGTGMTIVSSRMSGMAGNAFLYTGIITAVMSAFLGTFWAVMNLKYNKKRILSEENYRKEKYIAYLQQKEQEIDALYAANTTAMLEKYASAEQIASYHHQHEALWNRNVNHADLLTYRLGLGDVQFPVEIEVQRQRFTLVNDELEQRPHQIKEQYSVLHQVPVCVDLLEKSLIGVIGDVNSWEIILQNLMVQIAGNNSYTDIKMALVYDDQKIPNPQRWEFAKWLPHLWSVDKKTRFLATNKNEAAEVFYSLSQVFRSRMEESQTPRPYYVLFVLNKELLEGELINKYIGQSSSQIGLATVIAAEHYEELPNHCEFIMENNSSFSGVYSTTGEQDDRTAIVFDRVAPDKLLAFAKRLANIEIHETEQGGELPSSVTFFDMYGITHPQDLHAEDRWRRARTSESMKALIGIKSGGSSCYLDLHERYHGPHGLVAGTTGSGKSETLQTYILSLAIDYSPDDIGFFIIDYKGGGMANLFHGLPHIIGAISNLSGNQVKRAMVSIKAENKRRQRVFSQYGVNNINAYTSLYKNGDAKEPIPHMLIIIDEFAELKREESEFMKELVSVAQVGRSLGVHLILATQKPAGTVDENIWSNSKFRLCLRVQDRQDSMDMLHRPEAAYLTQAGRGYLQVGNDELFELFQSGYSGAVYDEALGDQKLVVAQMLDSTGKVDLVGNHAKIQYQEQTRQRWLQALCNAVKAAKTRKTADLLEPIYDYLQQQGLDFRRSQYNDSRLRDFVRLYDTVNCEEQCLVAAILEEAIATGVRLPEQKTRSQLEAVTEYLAQVAQSNGYNRVLQLWMPTLPEHLLLTEIEEYESMEIARRHPGESAWELSVIIGKGDDPENQSQMPICVDFANNGHHVLCGTVSTGRSTFLQTTVFALLQKYTEEEVQLYLLDFSSKLLSVFSDARQVGGILTDSEEDREKIDKLFTMFSAILAERKALLTSTNFRDYVEHSRGTLPAIILVIDNYGGFREKTEDQYEEQMKRLAKEGLNYGIYLLVTAGGFGISEMPGKMADNFRTTMCLEMPDIYQYGDVMRVVKPPIYPESNVKGRGLVYYGERILEFQTALACEGESSYERNENIRRQIARSNNYCKGMARKIPMIPEKPRWEQYCAEVEYNKILQQSHLLPNGYNARTAAYSALDLTRLLTYLVTGTKKSGKSTYLKTLIQASIDKGCKVFILELKTTEFSEIAQKTGATYINTGEGLYEFSKQVLLEEVRTRAAEKSKCLEQHLEAEPFFAAMDRFQKLCIFIPNALSFVQEIYDRGSQAFYAKDVLETLVGDKGHFYNFYFFVEAQDADAGDLMGYPWFKQCCDAGVGIRFGGKYLSQKYLPYANIPYKYHNTVSRAGIGTASSEEEMVRVEQIVVPDYRG